MSTVRETVRYTTVPGDGGSTPPPPEDPPALDFSKTDNSQYIGVAL